MELMEHSNLLHNQKLNSFLAFLTQEVTTLPGVKLVGPLALSEPIQSNLENWPCLYIDGGLDFKELYPAKRALSLGDGDSAKSRLEALDVRYPEDKDKSDLALALELLEELPLPIKLIGFSGGRREHEWAVMGEAMSFLKVSKCPIIYWDQHSFLLPAGTHRLSGHGTFSLFTIENKGIRLSGAIKFPVDPPRPFGALSSLGISNVASGEFELTALGPVLICQAEGSTLAYHS